jgi:hypothetical protein
VKDPALVTLTPPTPAKITFEVLLDEELGLAFELVLAGGKYK